MEPLFLSPFASTSPKTEFDLMPSYSSGKAGVYGDRKLANSLINGGKGEWPVLTALPVRRMTSTAITLVKGKMQNVQRKRITTKY